MSWWKFWQRWTKQAPTDGSYELTIDGTIIYLDAEVLKEIGEATEQKRAEVVLTALGIYVELFLAAQTGRKLFLGHDQHDVVEWISTGRYDGLENVRLKWEADCTATVTKGVLASVGDGLLNTTHPLAKYLFLLAQITSQPDETDPPHIEGLKPRLNNE